VIVAGLLAGYRLIRRQSVQQAVSGLFGVLIAAAIAGHTGQARGFFLLGIAGSVLYGAVFAVTLLVRRPLVGLLWEFLDPAPLPEGVKWYRVSPLRRAYDVATLAGLGMFAARAVVQLSLFRENRTGWLAVTKIVMGFPLYLAVLAFGFWVVRRARQQLPPLPEAVAVEPPVIVEPRGVVVEPAAVVEPVTVERPATDPAAVESVATEPDPSVER